MNLSSVDWFGFRTTSEIADVLHSLSGSFDERMPALSLHRRKGGWNGFKSSANLCLGDMVVGMIAYGGESQRGMVAVNISGTGCSWLNPDWSEVQRQLQVLPGYELRRVDIAIDTYHREVTHQKVVEAYRNGMFKMAGRPPSMTRIEPEDPLDGATIYIGKRQNSKFLRCYEKGLELVKTYPRGSVTHLQGVPVEDIYRVELEMKAADCILPVDLIDRRDQYFAGAYPYLQTIIDVKPEIFTQRREVGPQSSLEGMLANIRQQYGSTLFTALTAHGGDIGAVWEKIVGYKHNADLLASGVLLVDHI